MKTTYRNTFPDILAFMWRHYSRRVTLQASTLIFVAFTSMSTLRAIPDDASVPVKIVTFIFMETLLLGTYLLAIGLLSILGMVSKMNKTILTEHTITIAEGGLREETVFNQSEFKWAGIQKIVRTNRHVFAYISQHASHVIPKRAFATQAEWDDFFKTMMEFKDRSTQQSAPPLPRAPQAGHSEGAR